MSTTPPIRATTTRHGWLIAGFLLAFAATGAVLWPLSYSEVQLPNSLMRPLIIVVALAAFLARLKGYTRFLIATLVIGAAVPAAIALRVVVDTATDPTSHNLWPFELFLGGFVGHACAALGALIAIPWLKKARK